MAETVANKRIRMPEVPRDQPAEPNLSSIEGNLFGALFSFHDRILKLLRQASLEDDKLNVVTERIKRLLEDATAEMERTKDFSNLAHRLDAAYDEIQQFVDESPDADHECSNNEQASSPE
jgi:ElaB/YqjD/DUF883 family membrane-anchored ribosome-binding protein